LKKYSLLIIIVICSLLTSCILKPVKIADVKDISLKNIGKKSITIEFILPVTNPNPVKITVTEINFDIFINGEKINSYYNEKKIIVPAGNMEEVPFKTEIRYRDMLTGTKGLLQSLFNKQGEIHINGYIKIKVLCFYHKFIFNKKKHLG